MSHVKYASLQEHGGREVAEGRGAAEIADFSKCWNNFLTASYFAKIFNYELKTCSMLGCSC